MLARIFSPGRVISALSVGLATVSIGLFIGLGAHSHNGMEHCTNDMKTLLEQAANVSWASVALITLIPVAWFGILMSVKTKGWGVRIAANAFLFAAQFLVPLLAGVALAKLELATRSCADVPNHIPLAVTAVVFAVLWPIITVLLSRMSLDNYPILSSPSGEDGPQFKSDLRMYVLFKVLCGIAFGSQIILCVLFGLFGGSFATHLQDRIDADCSGNTATHTMEAAPALASAGGWLGLSVSLIAVLVWPLMVYTRNQTAQRFDWYRPLTAVLLSICVVLQSLAAGLISGIALEPADGLWEQLCEGSYSKYQAPAIIIILLLCFHVIAVVLLVRVRTVFTLSAGKICDPNVDDDTAESTVGAPAPEFQMAERPDAISAHTMLSKIVSQ